MRNAFKIYSIIMFLFLCFTNVKAQVKYYEITGITEPVAANGIYAFIGNTGYEGRPTYKHQSAEYYIIAYLDAGSNWWIIDIDQYDTPYNDLFYINNASMTPPLSGYSVTYPYSLTYAEGDPILTIII
ncbi:MAG: hypothetical protein JXA68_03265, partial [Ignavibacteriales bacterium]|nr:hypothetical protein [Ignavibacteriales bacterium]